MVTPPPKRILRTPLLRPKMSYASASVGTALILPFYKALKYCPGNNVLRSSVVYWLLIWTCSQLNNAWRTCKNYTYLCVFIVRRYNTIIIVLSRVIQ